MMPVAGQDAVFDRAAVKRETKMRATVIEREDAILIVHDEQWAGPATEDGHAPGLQLIQRPGTDPIVSRRLGGLLITRLEHRASVHHYCRRQPLRLSNASRQRAVMRPLAGLDLPLGGHRRLRRRLLRHEPARVTAFEPAGAPMTLQRDAEMVRPDRHPELA